VYHCNMFPPEFPALIRRCAPWLAPAEVDSPRQVLPGSGALMRRGPARIAIYRDWDGVVRERNAACPHCGNPVEWNSMDRTWDCVAHGVRFDALGAALNGPDNRPLRPAP
jgi:Rieske Fe-S protein